MNNPAKVPGAVDVVNTSIRPFGIKDKIGYMFGDFGNDFLFIFISNYLMLYYTNILGISAAIVGTLFMTGRFVDAFTDIGMGRIVDNAKPHKDGRYRVWIKRMAPFAAIAGLIVFLPIAQNLSGTGKIVYIFVTYILWGSFAYTSINIPYGSMAAAITANPIERGELSTFRSVGATLAGLFIGLLVPIIVYDDNSNLIGNRFFLVACVFAVCAFICYMLCYAGCRERVTVEPKAKDKKESAGQLVKQLFSNRALISIIVCSILLTVSMFTAQSMTAYLYNDYFRNPTAMSLASIAGVLPTLILAPFTKVVIKKWGKKEAGTVGLLASAAIYLIIWFLHLKNAMVFVVMVFLAGFGMGLFNMLIWAFITDVIDAQEVISGEREDGTVYGIYSFARKMGQALAGGISGFALTGIGYIVSTGDQVVTQSESVLNGIYNISTLVPAIGYAAIALLLAFWYPLGKKQIAENQRKLGLETVTLDGKESTVDMSKDDIDE